MSASSLGLFTSDRERRLWLGVLAAVAAIYSTLGLARTWAGRLLDRGWLDEAFFLGLFLIVTAIVMQGLKARPRGLEIGAAVGVASVYLFVFLRMLIPEQRSHLIEYTIVALLIYEALTERSSRARVVPRPALLAIAMTALVGALDECIQALLPSRVFDARDILFNSMAAVMAVVASATLGWVRRRVRRRRRG